MSGKRRFLGVKVISTLLALIIPSMISPEICLAEKMRTKFYAACSEGRVEEVKRLLKEGADPNTKGVFGLPVSIRDKI